MGNLENGVDITPPLFNFDEPFQTTGELKKFIELLLADKKQAMEKVRAIDKDRKQAIQRANSYKERFSDLFRLLGAAYKERDVANEKLSKLLLDKSNSNLANNTLWTDSNRLSTLNFVPDPILTHSTATPTPKPAPPSMNPTVSQGSDNSNIGNFTFAPKVGLQTRNNGDPWSVVNNNNALGTMPDFGMSYNLESYNTDFVDITHDASSSHGPSDMLNDNLGFYNTGYVDNLHNGSSSYVPMGMLTDDPGFYSTGYVDNMHNASSSHASTAALNDNPRFYNTGYVDNIHNASSDHASTAILNDNSRFCNPAYVNNIHSSSHASTSTLNENQGFYNTGSVDSIGNASSSHLPRPLQGLDVPSGQTTSGQDTTRMLNY